MANQTKAFSNNSKVHSSFASMLPTAFLMCVVMFVLIMVARNVTYKSSSPSLALLDTDKVQLLHSDRAAECLLLYEDDAMGNMGLREMSAILSQMKVRYDTLECAQEEADVLDAYDTLVLSVTHYQYLDELLGNLKSWVRAGGNLMILYPPEVSGSFQSLFDILGIRDCGGTSVYVLSLIHI